MGLVSDIITDAPLFCTNTYFFRKENVQRFTLNAVMASLPVHRSSTLPWRSVVASIDTAVSVE